MPIQVKQTMPEPAVAQIKHYLRKTGWNYVTEINGFSKFEKRCAGPIYQLSKPGGYAEYKIDGAGSAELLLDLNNQSIGLDVRCVDILYVISDVEKRPEGDVLKEILDLRCASCGFPV